MCRILLCFLLRVLRNILDAAAVEERILRIIVHISIQDCLESLDGVLERNILSGNSGELLRYVERL